MLPAVRLWMGSHDDFKVIDRELVQLAETLRFGRRSMHLTEEQSFLPKDAARVQDFDVLLLCHRVLG